MLGVGYFIFIYGSYCDVFSPSHIYWEYKLCILQLINVCACAGTSVCDSSFCAKLILL